MLIRHLLKYLRFLRGSTNQHGVHSPFIYAFVTKCLYALPKDPTISKPQQVLLKSKEYFKARKIKIYGENETITRYLTAKYGNNEYPQPPYDIIYVDQPSTTVLKLFLSTKNQWHNDTMVILNNIYDTKETGMLWKKFREIWEVRVTVDLFYCGVLFFRKEQVKQHFKIRI